MNEQTTATLNLPEYNKETGKHTITLEIIKSKKPCGCIKADVNDCIYAWMPVIVKAVAERLRNCKNNLAAAVLRDDILETSEYGIRYIQNGMEHHYSYPAAKAMKFVLDCNEKYYTDWVKDPACITQVLKALAWVPTETRNDCKGYSYQVLVDILWEHQLMILSRQYMQE